MDRELAYTNLVGYVEGMRLSDDSLLYQLHRLELFVRVSALADAVGHDIMGLKEAEKILLDYIQSLRTPTQQADTGEIKF